MIAIVVYMVSCGFRGNTMPKDKTASRKKIDIAIRQEFMEKGYEGASIRSIGERAGMTSAALYRHYKDKNEMFSSLVSPLMHEMDRWMRHHEQGKYDMIKSNGNNEKLCGESFIDLIKEIILPHRDEFYLLTSCSKGSSYENFIHDFVDRNQGKMMEAIDYLKKMGYPVLPVSEEEIHMLLSAYLTALFEPIIHGYDNEKIRNYLERANDFFAPGWKKIMGLDS